MTTAIPPPVDVPDGRSGLPRRARFWLLVIGAGVAFAIIGGTIAMLSSQPSKVLARACVAGACHHGVTRTFGSTHQPSARTPKAGTHHSPTPTHGHRTPAPTRSSPSLTAKPTRSSPPPTSSRSPSPSPTPSPTSTSTPSPTPKSVTVSYSVVYQLLNSFQGRFTIVNKGSKAINGWEIAAVLPNDRIQAAWPATFHTSGDTLYLDPPSGQKTIAPGATLTENFSATGTTTTPTSCTFNGSPC